MEKWRIKLKKGMIDFDYARNGDHIITPFQCDLCVFRRIQSRDPSPFSDQDNTLLAYIRRANLDSMWSRGIDPVNKARCNANRIVKGLSEEVGISKGPFYDPGPTEAFDSFGYIPIIAMLQASRRPGKLSDSHLQWSSLRKEKATIASQERLNNRVFGQLALVEDADAIISHFQSGGTSSVWFQRFVQGLRARMGDSVQQNMALEANLISKVIL